MRHLLGIFALLAATAVTLPTLADVTPSKSKCAYEPGASGGLLGAAALPLGAIAALALLRRRR